jgi:GT2 family glycosyltransferase/glycosyltransferase involved in cell wall biosynthesis
MDRSPKNYLNVVPLSQSDKGANESVANFEVIPSRDFFSKGNPAVPDSCFTETINGEKAVHPRSHLRREFEHDVYSAPRSPVVDFLNRDEVLLLHNLALQFRGRPGLEIGCWGGWSTYHLALAGVVVDVIDPIITEETHLERIRGALAAAGVLGNVRLFSTTNPNGVRELATISSVKWSFFFINGNRKGALPAKDAAECLEHAAPDAMIVFHSLIFPEVEQGLQILWQKGWNVLVYQTKQIMGVAWRGSVQPVAHQVDPSIPWMLPLHLTKYPVSGELPHDQIQRLSRCLALFQQEDSRIQLESAALRDSVRTLQSQILTRDREIEELRKAVSTRDAELKTQNEKVANLKEHVRTLNLALDAAKAQVNDISASLGLRETILARYLQRFTENNERIRHLFLEVEKLTGEVGRLTAEPGGVYPPFQTVIASSLWRTIQPMRRLRASRFAPKLNLRLLALASRILRSVRLENSADQYMSLGPNREKIELFDEAYYCEMNPDVARSGVDPFIHYITYGAAEGRDPHPLFDTSFYCERNPEIRAMGLNPLFHFITLGAAKDRAPHPLFDISFYKEQKPQIRDLAVNPLIHFLREGPTREFDPLTPTPEFTDTGICIVTPDIVGPVKNGGIGTACYHFARLLAKAGHPVSILFSGELGECQMAHWRNHFARINIKFIALADTSPVEKTVYGSTWFYERSWRIFEYLRKAHYSVIHFQDWHANGFWSIKAKTVGLAFEHTSLTLMTHSCTKWINEGMEQFGAEPFETAKLVWAETYCMEHCDVLLSPSHYMIEWLTGKGVQLPAKTEIAPYAGTDKNELETPLGINVDNGHLIFFGRLETRKGLHIFCDAIRKLLAECATLPRKISFLGKYGSVLGMGAAEYLDSFSRELSSIEIRIYTDFDYVKALAYIRNSSGLVVICPIVDNYPMTVIESIQYRLPFIAAATGGIPELVNKQVTFEPTVDSLADCLRRRSTINHEGIIHNYSPGFAEKVWLEFHAGLNVALSPAFDKSATVEKARNYPTVSICIPYFDHGQYLQTLVTAIARQSYPAFEAILVNDGSCQESTAEFNRIQRNNRDARFKFLSSENHGPGAARNRAVESSTGQLLLFFDADNLPKNADFVTTLVRAIQRSGADCVTVPYDIVGPERVLVNERDVIATYRPTGPCLEAGFFENVLGDSTMIIDRSAFESIGGFPTSRASWEDHEFLLNLCLSGLKLESLPESTFFYRQSPSGRNQRANEFHNYQSLFDKLQSGKAVDLARIISSVSGPLLMAKRSTPRNNPLAG